MNDTDPSDDPAPDRPWAEAGGAMALGLFVGMVAGGVLGLLAIAGTGDGRWFVRVFFGTTAAGALAGLVSSTLAFGLFEGGVHFMTGLFGGLAGRPPKAERGAPSWLRVAMGVGVVCGVIVLVLFRPR